MPSRGAIERKALGRFAKVGDLYDAHAECFTGNSLLKTGPPPTIFRSADTAFTETQIVTSDKFSEKSEKLNLDTELKVSVLGGLSVVEGSGRYLQNEKESGKAVRCSLIHSTQTKVEQLDLSSEELKDWCDFDAVDSKATHIVIKVSYGANTIVTTEYANHEKTNINDVKHDLQAHLRKLTSRSTCQDKNYHGNTGASDSKKCVVHVFADVVPPQKLPQSFEEALEMMKHLREHLTASNSGKGIPLTFMLMPVSQLKDYLKLSGVNNQESNQMDREQLVAPFIKIFDELSTAKQALYDLYTEMEEHDNCVTKDELEQIIIAKSNLNDNLVRLKAKLGTLLVDLRSGLAYVEPFDSLKSELQDSLQHSSQVQTNCSQVVKKIGMVDIFTKEGATFIGLGSPSEPLQQNGTSNVYVLYYSEKCKQMDIIRWNNNKTLFLNLIESTNAEKKLNRSKSSKPQDQRPLFIVLDIDLRPELMLEVNMAKSIRICLYRNGKCVNRDVLQSNETQQLLCIARATGKVETVHVLPEKLVILSICCPGSISGNCPAEDLTWLCEKCNKHIQYGFDGHFYCKCNGNARLFTARFKFKCNSPNHGDDFISFDKQLLWPLLAKIKPSSEYLNILILGETGVGKSTWINGIANYTTFSSLEEATGSEPMSLIASSFTVMDDNLEEKVVTIGDDKNENFKTGQSATQDPKAYVFNWKGTTVRLIDTPGIGDTRGIDQDKANFEAILKFLSELKEIHGICILLKPNNARLGVMFRFCIKELLTHLHRTCSHNIVFCFTNARNTFYKPGDTFPALKALLLENKEVEIVLSKDTVYCMDNESFRYLCMIHNGVASDESEMELYSTSWDKSVTETNRLLEHVKSLKPHVVQDTISMNDTRRIIVNLTKPIASISQNIQANIAVIEDKKNEIKASTERLEDLKKKLYVPGIDLTAVPLGYPRTVCTSPHCVKYHTIENTGLTKIEYTTHCHPHCYLVGVRPESYPNPELMHCAAMNGTQCTKCHCEWSKHMHITYDQVHKSLQVVDASVENLINSKKTDTEKIELFIQELEARQKALQDEQATIRSACAKFGTFLKNNAMLTYNDALAEYLDVLIKQEKEKCHSGGDRRALEGLETMRQEYLEEVATLQMAIKSGNNAGCLSIVEINRLVKTLYALPLKGAELKQHMEVCSATKGRMISYNETHCYPTYRPGQQKYKMVNPSNQTASGSMWKKVKNMFWW